MGMIARALTGSALLKISNIGFGFLVAVILARQLGAENYGVFSLAFVIVSVLAIFVQFGLPNLTIRETAKALEDKDWPRLRRIWLWVDQRAAMLLVAIGGAAVLALYLFADSIGEVGVATMAMALLLLPLMAFDTLKGAVLRGLGYIVRGQLSMMFLRPAFFVLLLAGAWASAADLTPALAMALRAAAMAGALVLTLWWLWNRIPAEARAAAPAATAEAGWMAAAFSMALMAGMNQINNYVDILILGALRPTEEVGLYRIAFQVATLAGFGLRVVAIVAAPRFAKLAHGGTAEAALQREITLMARLSLAAAVLVGVVLSLFGEAILDLAFGAEFAAAYPALLILLAGQILNAFFGPIGILMAMVGLEKKAAAVMIAAALVNVIANAALIPFYGLYGAAIATLLSFLIWNIAMWRILAGDRGLQSDPFGKKVTT